MHFPRLKPVLGGEAGQPFAGLGQTFLGGGEVGFLVVGLLSAFGCGGDYIGLHRQAKLRLISGGNVGTDGIGQGAGAGCPPIGQSAQGCGVGVGDNFSLMSADQPMQTGELHSRP